jgi:hypothetical protein
MNLLAIWVKSDAPHCKMGDSRIYCLLLLKLLSSKLWDAARCGADFDRDEYKRKKFCGLNIGLTSFPHPFAVPNWICYNSTRFDTSQEAVFSRGSSFNEGIDADIAG